MSTRLLLSSSALFLAIIGLALTFAPQEILAITEPLQTIAAQLLGAALCGFALLNWMSKGTAMGGIYGRPLAMGNLAHFTAGGLALMKVAEQLDPPWLFFTIASLYLLFAALFARAAFFTRGPSSN
jgi:hypothetical protein